jgi:DNA-directed RNA polymerase subunit RPC12/RpoP
MDKTIYVCSKCGAKTTNKNERYWLIRSNPSKSGEMVIRCPDHVTAYAERKAGLSVGAIITRETSLYR